MAITVLRGVVQHAASLLNAVRWKNFLQGSILAGTPNLIVTDAVFTGDDVGKRIAIDGAAAGGAIHEDSIAAFVDATHMTLTSNVAATVVGATVSVGGQLGDDRRNLLELREGAFQADEAHYLPLAETKGHWKRPELLILSPDIAHNADLGDVIPRIGALGRVFIQTDPLGPFVPGTRAQIEEITRMRANTGIAPDDTYGALAHNVAGSQIGGYFWMPTDENTVQYTGSSLKVYYVPAYTRGTDLKTPLIYSASLASFIVAALLAKEGAKMAEHAAVHQRYCEAVITGIRANQRTVPTLEEFQSETTAAR